MSIIENITSNKITTGSKELLKRLSQILNLDIVFKGFSFISPFYFLYAF